jgi:hypothetical protein
MDDPSLSDDTQHLTKTVGILPLPLGLLASQAVSGADACFQLLEANRLKIGPLWILPDIPDGDRFALSTDNRLLQFGVLEAIGLPQERICERISALEHLQWCGTADVSVVDQWIRDNLQLGGLSDLQSHLVKGRAHLMASVGEIKKAADKVDGRKSLGHPAMLYFLQQAAPIYLRHGEWPRPLLLRAAKWTSPDFTALDRLVRSDRAICRHPFIERAISLADCKVAKEYQQVIKQAKLRRPQKVAITTLKARLAGLVSAAAERFGCEVEAARIGQLFHTHARHEKKTLSDSDIPAYVGTLRRYIHRGRPHWMRSLPAMRNFESIKSVRTLLDRIFYYSGHENARESTS